MDSTFWKSWPGVATITGLGVAAAAAVAYAVSKVTPAAAPVPGGGGASPVAGQQFYLFSLTTPSIASNDPTGAAYNTVTTALTQTGYFRAPLQLEEDPTNPNGWVGIGLWTGAGVPAVPATFGTITSASVLPANVPAVSYTGMVVNTWYTFSFRTWFPSTYAQALQAAAAVASSLGFSPGTTAAPMQIVAAAQDAGAPTNPMWNVAAMWVGTTASLTTLMDRPPLAILVPPAGGSSAAPVALSGPPAAGAVVA